MNSLGAAPLERTPKPWGALRQHRFARTVLVYVRRVVVSSEERRVEEARAIARWSLADAAASIVSIECSSGRFPYVGTEIKE
jgi:hypothetical protein